jgi:hypothetical protein
VLIFNASTRLTGMSLNAAYALLTQWSLRLSGDAASCRLSAGAASRPAY